MTSTLLPLGFAAIVLTAIAGAALRPVVGDVNIVFFPPSVTYADRVAAVIEADGLVVGAGPVIGSILAQSDQHNFPKRLKSNGAWLVTGSAGDMLCTTPTLKSANLNSI